MGLEPLEGALPLASPSEPRTWQPVRRSRPGRRSGGAILRPEQIDMKLNGRKRPVNPNGGVGVDEPIDENAATRSRGDRPDEGAVRPRALPDLVASGDAPPRMSTAPIDYVPGYGPDGAGPSTGDGGGMGGDTDEHLRRLVLELCRRPPRTESNESNRVAVPLAWPGGVLPPRQDRR